MIPRPSVIDVATKKPALEVADIFREHFAEYRQQYGCSWEEIRAVNALVKCRTAQLGGLLRVCDGCGRWQFVWKACKHRNCPKCGGFERALWLERLSRILLPTHYHQVVFTIAHEINEIAYHNQKVIYDLLFASASRVLKEFGGRYLGGEPGMSMALHTWGQTLQPHIHLHVMVSGGGLVEKQEGWEWRSSKPSFLFPVVELSTRFRELFCAGLLRLERQGRLELRHCVDEGGKRVDIGRVVARMKSKSWEVYIQKPPKADGVMEVAAGDGGVRDAGGVSLPEALKQQLADPMELAGYLGRYVHQSALSNSRLTDISGGEVSFRYYDNRDVDKHGRGVEKVIRLSAVEFMRRFLWHVLPKGYVRIRHYGLHHSSKRVRLGMARILLGLPSAPKRELVLNEWLMGFSGEDPSRCPFCGQGRMVRRSDFGPLKGWRLVLLMVLGVALMGSSERAEGFR